jgi:hypothetical protein
MVRHRRDPEQVRLSRLGREALDELVNILSTTTSPLTVRDWELAGALILAAHRIPVEAVKAVVDTYREAERAREEAAALAVIGFLRAHSGPSGEPNA